MLCCLFQNYCKQHGGYLLSIETSEENIFLKDFIGRLNSKIIINHVKYEHYIMERPRPLGSGEISRNNNIFEQSAKNLSQGKQISAEEIRESGRSF